MKRIDAVEFGPMRSRRRMVIAASWVAAAGMGLGLTAVAQRGGTAARPPAVTPQNHAAAEQAYKAARDLYDQGKYKDAQVQNDKALTLDPNHDMALLLRSAIEAKMAAAPVTPAGAPTGAPTGPGGKPSVLNATQINVIKLMELSSKDTVRGSVDKKTLEDFWNEVVKKDPIARTTPQDHDAFINPNNFSRAAVAIRDSNNQKYMEKVKITNDPASIVGFREVNQYIHTSCGECHEGEKAGKFRLVPPNGGAQEDALYTNFYIMSTFSNKDGKVIDRASPEKSLFLQYSLPKDEGQVMHPGGERRSLPNTNDRRYVRMLEWVRSLAYPQPNYGITYELPHGTTQPGRQE